MSLALKEIHPVSHATERQLVRAVREGDDRAFEQLFARFRRRISAYVYGLVNDHGRAEDITQEVFISALRRLRETERPISFKPWIYEIARNACIDEFRRLSRASLVSLEAEAEPEGLAPRQLADHSTPEVRWERKQQMGDLFGAFSSLPDNQHRILVLRELEGLSYGEIGARMGMSRPMVESTLFRARRRLTQEYDELASGRRCLEVQAAVDGRDARGLATLGIRERRRISRHLHHCQDCLRHARLAGVDDAALRVPGPARRVAALLPFGWLRLAWHRAGAKVGGPGSTAAHRASALAEGSPQSVAVGRAAAAAAALIITGGGITAIANHGHPAHPAAAQAVSAAVPNWSPASAEHVLLQVPYLVVPRADAAATPTAPSRPAARSHRRVRRTGAAPGAAGGAGSSRGSSLRSRSATRSGSRSSTSTARSVGVSLPSGPSTPGIPVSSSGLKGVIGGVLNTLPGAVPAPIRQPLGQVTSTGTKAVGGVTSKLPVVGSGGPPLPPVSLPTGTVQLPSRSIGPTVPSITTPGVTTPSVKTPSVSVPAASGVTIPGTSLPGVHAGAGKPTLP
jgi:RNA polymerase sigma factor (sigma-70 family)